MKRVARWVADLRLALDAAEDLANRGRAAFDSDPAVPLAFEALSSRVGEIVKQLHAADSERFADEVFALAARNGDFVVHHDDRIDRDALWQTVTRDFPQLRLALDAATDGSQPPREEDPEQDG